MAAGGAGSVSVTEGSLPGLTAAGTSCNEAAVDGAAFGSSAAEGFLSVAVVRGAAAETGCGETPSLLLLGASFVVVAIAAGALGFGMSFGVEGGALLLALLFALLSETVSGTASATVSLIANPVSGALAVCAAAVVFVCGGAAGVGGAETPGLPLLMASFVVAAIGGGVGAGGLEFGVRFGARGGSLLLRLLATANPTSGGPAVCAAAMVASDERS